MITLGGAQCIVDKSSKKILARGRPPLDLWDIWSEWWEKRPDQQKDNDEDKYKDKDNDKDNVKYI